MSPLYPPPKDEREQGKALAYVLALRAWMLLRRALRV
jgi:hypothetical protein